MKSTKSASRPAKSTFTRNLTLAALVAAAMSTSAHAAVIVNWDGSDSTAWATAGNWDSAPANTIDNATGSIANFNLATYGGNPVYAPNAGTTSINGISIGASNGAMTLAGTQLTIGDGGISIANGAAAVTISSPITLGAAQTWTNADDSNFTASGAITNNGFDLTIDTTTGTDTLTRATISNNITGNGKLIKNGPGRLVLSRNGGYGFTGGLEINNGRVDFTGTTGTISSTVTFTGSGDLYVTAGPLTVSGLISTGGAGNISGDNSVRQLRVNVAAATTYTYEGTFTGAPTGNVALSKRGDGTQILTSNTLAGGKAHGVLAGKLQIGNGGSTGEFFDNTGVINVVHSGATLELNRTGTYSFDKTINGAGTLAITGGVALTMTNTYNDIANVTIGGGSSLIYNGGTAAAIADRTTTGTSGVLNFGDYKDTAGMASLAGVQNGMRIASIGGTTVDNYYVFNAGATNHGFYNGSNVNSPNFAAGPTFSYAAATGLGAVTVNNTGTLKGTGTIAGLVTVKSGGAVSPGTSPGTQTYAGGLTVEAGGFFNWEHNAGNALGTASTNWDVANITGGSLTLDNTASTGSKLRLYFDVTTDFTNSFWNSTQTWDFITGNVSGSNTFNASNISLFVNNISTSTSEGAFSTAVSGSNLQLIWTAAGGPSLASVVVTPASGSRGNGQTVAIDATPNDGTYTSSLTSTSGYGWSQAGITDGAKTGLNNDQTGTLTHLSTNSINGDNQGRFTTTISAASSGNGTYNYTLTRVVAGNVAPYGAGSTFGTTQTATILLGNDVAGYSVTGTRNVGLNQLGSDFVITDSLALTADTDLTMAIRRRVDGTANDEVTANDGLFDRFANDGGKLFSDVVSINGINGTVFVLAITYDPADLGSVAEASLRLGWLNNSDIWVNAVQGNTGGTAFFAGDTSWLAGIGGSLDAGDLGKYGVYTNDVGGNYVWAVLNHNSDFAVIPEPTSLGLLALGSIGLLSRRRRSK